MQFGAYITAGQREKMKAMMDIEKARIRRWKKPRQNRIAKIRNPVRRAAARARFNQRFADAVAAGTLITSRDTLIEPAVVAELDQRGWHGPYDPVPIGARGPGRRYGSTHIAQHRSSTGEWATRRIGVVLSDEVGARLERACWHEHKHLILQLQEFYGTYGDSPSLPDPRPGEEPSDVAKVHRDELRAQIETTGDILRAAVDRVIANPPKHD